MARRRRILLRRYGVAVGAVVVATLLRLVLDPYVGQKAPFTVFYLAVMVAAWRGGLGPAFAATLLGGIAGLLFILPPRGTVSVATTEDAAGFILYLMVSTGIALLGGAMHTARVHERLARLAAEGEHARLRESEARFRLLADTAPVLLWVAGADGRSTFFNKGWLDFRGRTLEQETTGGWAAGIHADDRLRCLDTFRTAFHGRQAFQMEYRLRREDGEHRWMLGHGMPRYEPDGSFAGYIGSCFDISDRRAAEAEVLRLNRDLRRRLAELRALLDVIPIGIAVAEDPSCDHIWANPALAELLELPPDANASLTAPTEDRPTSFKFISEEGRELAVEELPLQIAAATGQEVRDLELDVVIGDDRRVVLLGSAAPLFDEEQQVRGCVSAFLDITARRQDERTARFLAAASAGLADIDDHESALAQLARLAVPHFADVCVVDLAGPDGALRRLPGEVANRLHDPDGLLPLDATAALGPYPVFRTGRPELLADVAATDSRDPDRARELQRLREWEVRSLLCVPLRAKERVYGVLTFLTAESGRRYDPADLAFAEDLALRAAVAVENALLYRELRDADRRKDEFLAMLAHELRNPLVPIRNNLHILARAGHDQALLDQARATMERHLAHLVQLVDDLLDVSHLMRNRIKLQKTVVELSDVLAPAVAAIQPVMDAAGHRLEVTVPPGPLRLEADPERLGQAIGNLLHNAAKFTDSGGRITVTAARHADTAEIAVRDTGRGIGVELLPRVFDLFVQAEQPLARTVGGLGTGLTVCRRLVEMHGGTVTAHSDGPGQGSVFVVRLPLLREEISVRKIDLAEDPPVRHRVLVVDDNVDAAMSLALVLRLGGHAVEVAHEGQAALDAARRFRPTAVLLDLGLPGLDGYDVVRHLRREPGFDRVLMAAVTGYGQDEDRRRCHEAGFDVHLVKPVAPQELEDLLARTEPLVPTP